jgi:predicted RNA-binding protein
LLAAAPAAEHRRMTSWLVCTSPDNFERTRARGFTMQGFKTRQRKNVMERMQAGDRLAYYLTKAQVVSATAKITSDGFEDHEIIWVSKPGEDYPYRVKVEPDVVAEPDAWVPSESIIPGLDWVQRWPQEHWKLALRGNLRQIPDHDFDTLRGALL